ncbi:MAG: O-methyltransferase [Nesterenkonia sp.]
MSQTAKHASWAYTEAHASQDPVFDAARIRAAHLGSQQISAGTASALSVLAAASGASALVEIGTGVGISGAALLRGASRSAVLTSIDSKADHTSAAAEIFRAEGVPASRTRLITGGAQQVLPRLTSGGYDLVFINTEPQEVGTFAAEGLRLIRSGGLLVVNDALDDDRVPKPAVRQASTQAMRDLERAVLEDDRLVTTLFPTGTGLLVAVRR